MLLKIIIHQLMTVDIVIGPMLINHSLKTCLVYEPILAISVLRQTNDASGPAR